MRKIGTTPKLSLQQYVPPPSAIGHPDSVSNSGHLPPQMNSPAYQQQSDRFQRQSSIPERVTVRPSSANGTDHSGASPFGNGINTASYFPPTNDVLRQQGMVPNAGLNSNTSPGYAQSQSSRTPSEGPNSESGDYPRNGTPRRRPGSSSAGGGDRTTRFTVVNGDIDESETNSPSSAKPTTNGGPTYLTAEEEKKKLQSQMAKSGSSSNGTPVTATPAQSPPVPSYTPSVPAAGSSSTSGLVPQATGSSSISNAGRSWPTAEDEKSRLFERARANALRTQAIAIAETQQSTPPPSSSPQVYTSDVIVMSQCAYN